MTDSDQIMRGFLYLKALIARYGTDGSADLLTLADRAVAEGLWPNRREAVDAIETQMGLPVTMPMSEEVAAYSTNHKLPR
jgi:hypothetical protein